MSFCVVPFVRRLCTAHFSLPFKMPHVKSIFRYFSFFFVRWTVELDCWLDGNRCLHFAYFCGPFYNEITCSVTCYSCYHSLLLLVPPKWKWALPTENSLFLQHFLMVFFSLSLLYGGVHNVAFATEYEYVSNGKHVFDVRVYERKIIALWNVNNVNVSGRRQTLMAYRTTSSSSTSPCVPLILLPTLVRSISGRIVNKGNLSDRGGGRRGVGLRASESNSGSFRHSSYRAQIIWRCRTQFNGDCWSVMMMLLDERRLLCVANLVFMH